MKTAAVLATVLLSGAAARAQSIATEVDLTTGYSTEGLGASATQVRAFGEAGHGVSFFAETSWANRSPGETDAFGSAYPYGNRVQAIEAYAERAFHPGGAMVSVRAGRFRTPFGISGRSDHAYTGFLRAPLIRYDDYYALSNTALEHGADVLVGGSHVSVEASVGAPADLTTAKRRPGTDTSIRGQVYVGSLIVGASYARSRPNWPEVYAFGHASFTGIDARWMRNGVQLRGEWIGGQPFDGTTTTGGYLDLLVHRVGMGPLTAVVRIERLDYDTIPPYALYARRATIGGRARLLGHLTVQAGVVHQWGNQQIQLTPTALDLGVTYSLRREARRADR